MADQQATQGWQPIETAPKDGRPILLFGGYSGGGINIGAWGGSRPASWRDGHSMGRQFPRPCTHWMPLPEPPL